MTIPDAADGKGDDLARAREKRGPRGRDHVAGGEDEVRALVKWSLATIEESGGTFDVRRDLLDRGVATETVEAVMDRLRARGVRHPSGTGPVGERLAVVTDDDVDDRVLELRSQGSSFKRIRSVLGFDSATGPIKAFNRSLRRRPKDEQDGLLAEELERLATLERRVREDTTASREKVDRQLRMVSRIRAIVSG